MRSKKSQNQIIADYLKSGRTLTSLQAFRLCGTMCLAQRIANLRNAPYNLDIDTKMVYKGRRNYAVYSLKTEVKQTIFQKMWSKACLW